MSSIATEMARLLQSANREILQNNVECTFNSLNSKKLKKNPKTLIHNIQ